MVAGLSFSTIPYHLTSDNNNNNISNLVHNFTLYHTYIIIAIIIT